MYVIKLREVLLGFLGLQVAVLLHSEMLPTVQSTVGRLILSAAGQRAPQTSVHVVQQVGRVMGYSTVERGSLNTTSYSLYFISPVAGQYTTVERGRPNTKDYWMFFKYGDSFISPFHDIPMYADEANRTYNMVVEIPRWTNAKMEMTTKEPLNPIRQDIKKGNLRYVHNCFPHHGYIWNYGAIPQTWEDPGFVDTNTNCKGDNDPIDICEIGYRVAKRGDIIQVKILGIMALVDEGETDWKLLAIDVNDPLAKDLNDVDDIEKHMPGMLKATNEWFRIYKIPDGKPENQFAFNGEAKNREFAEKIIAETHEHWKALVQRNDTSPINCSTTTLVGNPHFISQKEAESLVMSTPVPGPDVGRDPIVDKWYYVTLK
ncbi:uncharacterized protein LOC135369032 isoform X2 [Ornithodoros turicata]|uniref:uncharacterized protein LOC135369032 isoform X2 n=1 Tax=Ornithodoros turicata TaxID=34597 RepID=UPI003139349C